MIDIKKQYRTRDGREVRIYATDGGQEYCIHGSVHHIALGWICHTWLPDGRSNMHTNCDLIEVRPRHKRVVWVNVYNENYGAFSTKEGADAWKVLPRIACLRVELDFAEGDGL